MQMRTIRINDFVKGALAGAGVVVLAGAMLGADQGQRSRPGQEGGGRAQGQGGPYFVTASGAGARLWQLNQATRELTFINEFNPVRRGGQ